MVESTYVEVHKVVSVGIYKSILILTQALNSSYKTWINTIENENSK